MAQKLNFNCEGFHWKSFLLSFSCHPCLENQVVVGTRYYDPKKKSFPYFCYMGDLGLKLTILDKLTFFFFRLLCKNLEWVFNPRQNYARAVVVDCSRWNDDKLFENSAIKKNILIEKSNVDVLRWYKNSSEIMRLYRNYCIFLNVDFVIHLTCCVKEARVISTSRRTGSLPSPGRRTKELWRAAWASRLIRSSSAVSMDQSRSSTPLTAPLSLGNLCRSVVVLEVRIAFIYYGLNYNHLCGLILPCFCCYLNAPFFPSRHLFSCILHLFPSFHHLFSSFHHLFSSFHHLFSSFHHLFLSFHHLFSSCHHLLIN